MRRTPIVDFQYVDRLSFLIGPSAAHSHGIVFSGDGPANASMIARESVILPLQLVLGWRQRLGEQRVEQATADGGGGGECHLQPAAEHHQRIDLGDDAMLFGMGWECDPEAVHLRLILVVEEARARIVPGASHGC
jgi:hypothetical protein